MTVEILQVSDTHIVVDPSELVYGQPSGDNLRSVLRSASATFTGAPDLVLVSGDVAEDGQAASYERVTPWLRDAAPAVRWVPGNHDDRARMQAVEPSWSAPLDLGPWCVVLVDSQQVGEVAGEIGPAELDRLQADLDEVARRGRHALVCLHHPPVHPVCDQPGCQLVDAADLLAVLARAGCVRAVVSGHLHRPFDVVHEGIRYLGAPSTCVQADHEPRPHRFTAQPPAGRALSLHDDGSLATRLVASV